LRSKVQTAKLVELHADFMAGIYMAGKKPSIDLESYAHAFFKIGDDEFTNPDHHGTPEERYLALKEGYAHRRNKPNEWVGLEAYHGEQIPESFINKMWIG